MLRACSQPIALARNASKRIENGLEMFAQGSAGVSIGQRAGFHLAGKEAFIWPVSGCAQSAVSASTGGHFRYRTSR
jgi:hypothetical protein